MILGGVNLSYDILNICQRFRINKQTIKHGKYEIEKNNMFSLSEAW